MELTVKIKNCDPSLRRFDTVSECDGQIDQTNIFATAKTGHLHSLLLC